MRMITNTPIVLPDPAGWAIAACVTPLLVTLLINVRFMCGLFTAEAVLGIACLGVFAFTRKRKVNQYVQWAFLGIGIGFFASIFICLAATAAAWSAFFCPTCPTCSTASPSLPPTLATPVPTRVPTMNGTTTMAMG